MVRLASGLVAFRVARPSRDLVATTEFYTRALGLHVLSRFVDHAGFDGVILGAPGWPFHLEFTRHRADARVPASTDEDLIVFYLPERSAWASAVARLHAFGARAMASSNPYWNARGLTFQDPDGYRIVLQNDTWP